VSIILAVIIGDIVFGWVQSRSLLLKAVQLLGSRRWSASTKVVGERKKDSSVTGQSRLWRERLRSRKYVGNSWWRCGESTEKNCRSLFIVLIYVG